jgi:hypothetical protein
MYSAACASGDGATRLRVTHDAPAGDVRTLGGEPLGPTFGYHLDDVNLAPGDPVNDGRGAEAACSH